MRYFTVLSHFVSLSVPDVEKNVFSLAPYPQCWVTQIPVRRTLCIQPTQDVEVARNAINDQRSSDRLNRALFGHDAQSRERVV